MVRTSAAAATLCACLWAASALAQDDGAAAQVLWDEAKALATAGNHAAACPKFAESHRLDPQLGTLLNLADCYATVGKLASAWARFVEAGELAAKRGDPRQEEAIRRADELARRLTKMRIDVSAPVDGLEVTNNGEPVREAMFGSALPIDEGEVTIVARAPGYRAWEITKSVSEEGALIEVTIPALELEAEEAGPTAPLADDFDRSPFMVAGIVVGSVGVVGVVIGAATAAAAKGADDDSLAHCLPDDPLQCSQEGVTLRDQAIDLQTASIISFVAGGLLTVTGAMLIVVSTMDDETGAARQAGSLGVLPQVGPGGAGLSFFGRW